MGIKTIWCPVLQTHVTCITDLEDRVVKVVCYEYEGATRTCRVKSEALKDCPLAQLLTQPTENSVMPRTLGCAVV